MSIIPKPPRKNIVTWWTIQKRKSTHLMMIVRSWQKNQKPEEYHQRSWNPIPGSILVIIFHLQQSQTLSWCPFKLFNHCMQIFKVSLDLTSPPSKSLHIQFTISTSMQRALVESVSPLHPASEDFHKKPAQARKATRLQILCIFCCVWFWQLAIILPRTLSQVIKKHHMHCRSHWLPSYSKVNFCDLTIIVVVMWGKWWWWWLWWPLNIMFTNCLPSDKLDLFGWERNIKWDFSQRLGLCQFKIISTPCCCNLHIPSQRKHLLFYNYNIK